MPNVYGPALDRRNRFRMILTHYRGRFAPQRAQADNATDMVTMKFRYLCLTAPFCGMIFWLSSQSSPPAPSSWLLAIPGMDKVGHAFQNGALTATVSVGMSRSNAGRPAAGQFWVPIAFAVLYGITDEIHQRYVPARAFEALDLLADTAGAIVIQVVLYGYLRRRRIRVRRRSRARLEETPEGE